MRNILLFCCLAVLATSCSINQSIMLKTDKYYEFDTPNDSTYVEYSISPNDVIQFRLFKMDGLSLVDVTSGITRTDQNALRNNNVSFLVEQDGRCNLPVIGRTNLEGLTIRQAEEKLEKLYERFYKNTYVQVQVLNRRVIVFPGDGGKAKVIQLKNNNTTLMEGLALSGGITNRGKAKKIKVIRKEGSVHKVFLVDLSKIDGLPQGDMILQSNDIIYVEPAPELASEIVRDIAPIVSLLSSAVFVYSIARSFNNN